MLDAPRIISAIQSQAPKMLQLARSNGAGSSIPDDAMRMRIIAGLSFVACAWLQIGGANPTARATIDDLSKIIRRLGTGASMRIGDLSPNQHVVQLLLQDFPPGSSASTKTDGCTALSTLWNVCGKTTITEMLSGTNGPFGPIGKFTLVFGDFVIGEEESSKFFMEQTLLIHAFCDLLLPANAQRTRTSVSATQSSSPSLASKSSGCAIVVVGLLAVVIATVLTSVAAIAR